MKIAVLLFGQPRFVNSDKVIQSYETLRNTYDVDFFLPLLKTFRI